MCKLQICLDFENGVKELNSRPKRAVFSPKVTIKKVKRKVIPFFLPPPVSS